MAPIGLETGQWLGIASKDREERIALCAGRPVRVMHRGKPEPSTSGEGVDHPRDRLDLLAESGHDFEELLRLGVRAWLESAFEHGLFHGDVHAGNLFLTSDSKVALLDFGIMGHLEPPMRAALRDALPGLLLGDDPRGVVEAFFALGAVTGPLDMERASEDVRRIGVDGECISD